MANFTPFIKRWWGMHIPTIWSDIRQPKDPHRFLPSGSQIFHGYQGEGKSASMWHAMYRLKNRYPRSIIATNFHLTEYKPVKVGNIQELDAALTDFKPTEQYFYFETHSDLIFLLRHLRNGNNGVIFAIDEIHNYFHSHDSKAMPMWVVQVFSQQRKQKMVILGTVQMWPDLIKAIRDQIDNLVLCTRVFGYFIKHTAVDPREFENNYGQLEAPVKKRGFFFLSKKLRSGYDTEQVINSGREIMGGQDLTMNVKIDPNSKESKNKRRLR